MADNPNHVDLTEALPGFGRLHPDEQMNLIINDPNIGPRYLSGEALAVAGMNAITERYAEFQKAERSRELAEALARHVEPGAKPDTPQGKLNALINSPNFAARYDAGDPTAHSQFSDLMTAAIEAKFKPTL